MRSGQTERPHEDFDREDPEDPEAEAWRQYVRLVLKMSRNSRT